VRPFEVEEIEDGVHCCDSNKAPGPDGYNFAFLKRFWSLIRDDVVKLMSEFHEIASLPKGFTAAFVTLVPKVDSPIKLNDLRPI
jgi:hypothetical protein